MRAIRCRRTRSDTLVPIAQERSADEDLLEDGSRKIETYLRERGYRAAAAPYARQERGERVVDHLHRDARAAAPRQRRVARRQRHPARIGDRVRCSSCPRGEPFVDARVAAITVAIEELYRVRGYERVGVKANVEVLPEQVDGSTRFRPVDVRFTVAEGPQTTVGAVVLDGVGPAREAGRPRCAGARRRQAVLSAADLGRPRRHRTLVSQPGVPVGASPRRR